MIRNEYRRAFIMLRSVAPGYGGHARLERRTLNGSLYIIVNAPPSPDALTAALAGQRDGEYYAAPLGELTRDRRGQATLALHFDPRNIEGRPLEAYPWIVVASAGAEGCAIALTGNVEGSRNLDLRSLRRAVSARVDPAQETPQPSDAADPAEPAAWTELPEGGWRGPDRAPEAPPEPAAGPEPAVAAVPGDDSAQTPPQAAETAEAVAEERAVQTADEPAGNCEANGAEAPDIRIYTGTRTRIFTTRTPSQQEAPAVEATPAETDAAQTGAAEINATQTGATETGVTETGATDCAAPTPEPYQAMQTAAQALGLDITRPWPEALEPLRPLFATQSPKALSPTDDHVYVRASMPGSNACYVGLRARDGAIANVRYAVPARYAPFPPAGLEGYTWQGDGAQGYWVMDGEPLPAAREPVP